MRPRFVLLLTAVVALLVAGLAIYCVAEKPPPSISAPDWPAYVAPRGYVCGRAARPPVIDGRLDDPVWQTAPWSSPFVDIEGDDKPAPRYRTRVKMLWDDRCLYIAAELEEPHVRATATKHDSYIFHFDNDFEVFLDPDGDSHLYAELEMNALNTTWDLLLTRPYKDGGKAIDAWEIAGLRTAVHVDGTLNDPRDTDRGWSIEIAWPWEGLKQLSKNPVPPRDGDQWRINFSRVQLAHEVVDGKYRKIKRPEQNWVWSPQGVIDMHRPETWGYLQFSAAAAGDRRLSARWGRSGAPPASPDLLRPARIRQEVRRLGAIPVTTGAGWAFPPRPARSAASGNHVELLRGAGRGARAGRPAPALAYRFGWAGVVGLTGERRRPAGGPARRWRQPPADGTDRTYPTYSSLAPLACLGLLPI